MGRYTKGAYDVQVIENLSGVDVLVRPHTTAVPADAPQAEFESLIKRCADDLLYFPDGKFRNAALHLTLIARSQARAVYSAALNCEYDPNDEPHRSRWNYIYCWTDGEVVAFSIAKLDGIERKPTSAIASDGKRFKDGG